MSNRKKHEKQDKVIEQLQKNQRAITSGFEDLVMLQQLPGQAQAEQTSKLPVDYKPAMMKSNLDDGFTTDEIQTLIKYELFAPFQWKRKLQYLVGVWKRTSENKCFWSKFPKYLYK